MAKAKNKIKITLVKSIIGTPKKHRATVLGLGLRRLNHTVIRDDKPEIRGMVNKIDYLLKVETS